MSKTALITGATSGLGFDFVKLFASDGYDLVLVSRNEQKMNEIKKSYSNVNITVIAKDLSKENAAIEVYDEIKKTGLQIDMLVNNAGFGLAGDFDQIDLLQQTEMLNLNINALTQLTHCFIPEMKQRKFGKILNVASTAAFQPLPKMAVYSASKAYVLSFSEAIAEELAGTGVTVTTLCPGATKTNFAAVANVENTKMFSRAMNSEKVAKQAYDALLSGKRVVITGGFNKTHAIFAKLLPRKTVVKISKAITSQK
jgi:uncharacterized protein